MKNFINNHIQDIVPQYPSKKEKGRGRLLSLKGFMASILLPPPDSFLCYDDAKEVRYTKPKFDLEMYVHVLLSLNDECMKPY